MDFKHSCVVDAEGYYKDLVLVAHQVVWRPPEAVPGGELEPPAIAVPVLEWVVQDHTLAEGDRLIDTTFPTKKPYTGADGFLRPRWDDDEEAWVEGATAEETIGCETEHPAPEPPPMNEITMTQLAVAELAQVVEDNKTETQLAGAELAEALMGGES